MERYTDGMDIRRQAAYTENVRRLLREMLTAHPEVVNHSFETAAHYKTICQIVAHLIGAEQRLTMKWLYGEERPAQYEDQPAETLEGLFADWDAIRSRTLTFAASTDGAALERWITMEIPQTVRLTAEEVLLHICNHQTWHLGQVSMVLQQFGIDPPNFDYILLRETSAPGE
jgi:uncharacterized damage-inducible protein DinB